MLTDKIRELEEARQKLAAIEAEVQRELAKELASLPSKYGFATVAAFVKAVRAATGIRRGRPAKSGATSAGGKKRRRAVITEEIRASVKKMVGEGKTGQVIADTLGISLPSVQNVKASLGMVKKRKT